MRALLALWGVGAISLAFAQGLLPIPKLEARVTDLTGTLTAEQQANLENKLAAFESRKGAQVAVLIVPTTAPEEIEQYGIRVAEQWKLGRGKVDDGALLLVAKNDKKMRIEVGYGLEGVLPDATSKRIIAETIAPLFRHGDFYGGINAGIDQMLRVIDGEPLPAPDRGWHGDTPSIPGGLLPFLFVGVLVIASILRSVIGRAPGALVTGGLTAGAVWLLSKVVGIALVAGVVAGVVAMFAGLSGRGGLGGWGGGLGGGGFGRGGFGGGGFGGGGGFSGGGGGFGGGGASGSW